MKNEMIQKINKLGRIGGGIVTFIRIMLIIALVAMSAAECLLLILPDDYIKVDFEGNAVVEIQEDRIDELDALVENKDALDTEVTLVESGNGKSVFNVDISMSQDKFSGIYNELRIGGIFVCLMGLYAVVITVFGKKLAKALAECETPFSSDVIRKLKIFAYSICPLMIIGFDAAIDSGFKISINVVGIVFVIAVFALVKIFEYGSGIQQENDDMV